MAISKGDQSTAKKTSDEPKTGTARKTERSYTETAATLSGDARDLADRIREDLAKLRERCITDFEDAAPGVEEAPTAGALQRIPMAIDDINRALDGLVVATTDLTRTATS